MFTLQDAETTYKNMTSRFKSSKESWMDYGAFLMAHGKHDAAHQLLQRSLQVLEKKDRMSILDFYSVHFIPMCFLEFSQG